MAIRCSFGLRCVRSANVFFSLWATPFVRLGRMIWPLGRRWNEIFGVGEPSFETSSGNVILAQCHNGALGPFPLSFGCRLGSEAGPSDAAWVASPGY